MVTQEQEYKPVVVWWDINRCPVPDCYNASLVGLSIEQTLSESGYNPVTITAIGNLRHTLKQHPDVLRGLSSSGIRLKHVLRGFDLDCLRIILEDMLAWIRKNPPPATLMLISGGVEDLSLTLGELRESGYTILRAYPQKAPSLAYPQKGSSLWDWERLLGTPEKTVFYPSKQRESGWVCTLCEPYSESFAGLNFEDFTTHLKSRDHALTEIDRRQRIKDSDSDSDSDPDPNDATSMKKSIGEEEDPMSIDSMPMHKEGAKTTVWWDINSCPVPGDYDARRVRPAIESALKKSGYSAPLTITAIGNLKLPLRQSPDVLAAISSTGILLRHVPSGFSHIRSEVLLWTLDNRPPATVMLISSGSVKDFSSLYGLKYTILRAVPLQSSSLPTSNVLWFWESLLKDSESQVLQENCSESGWFCTLCEPYHKKSSAGQNIEDFTTHLKSRDHALSELDMVTRPMSRKMIKLIQSSRLPEEPSKKRSREEEGGGGGGGRGGGEEDQWERSSLDSMLSKMLSKS